MIKLLKYLKKRDYFLIFIAVGLIVFQVWLDLKLPEYMKDITLYVTQGASVSQIWQTGGYMLLCTLGSVVSAVIVGFFASIIAASFAKNIRAKVFDKVENFSVEELQKFSTASLITRTTNDITQVQMTVSMGFQVLIKAPILAIWALWKISLTNWEWTLATGIALIVLISIISVIVAIVLPKFKVVQKLIDNLNRVTRENLTGIRVVRAYNAEDYEEGKFENANQDLTKIQLFIFRVMAVISPSMTMIMSGLNLAIYWIGAYLFNSASILNKADVFANMTAFSSYAMQVIMAFMMLTMIFIILPRAEVSANRINEVLNTKSKITNGKITDSKEKGIVEFKDVSFKYPDADEWVLKNINLKINKGQTVAFIGSTGSGKSTLINLVPRFYDCTQGQILLDGIDVKDYKEEVLHNKIGYVPQKAVIFSGTVKSNVLWGDNGKKKGSLKNIKKALKIAQATEFVNKMKGKLNAVITQGGTNLSGGQKQRLSIARAVARQPEIYIFDDTFSALDYKTDKLLRQNLKRETADVTSLIVAQRIGTIKDADQIVVLEQGEVVGIGNHKFLMKNCKVYKEIALSQLSKEELQDD